MTSQWKRPGTVGLVENLQAIADALQAILPQVVDAQSSAIKAMAEMAVTTSGRKSEDNDA